MAEQQLKFLRMAHQLNPVPQRLRMTLNKREREEKSLPSSAVIKEYVRKQIMTNSLVDHLCSRNRRAPEWRESKKGTCADGSWHLEREEISANDTQGCASMTA